MSVATSEFGRAGGRLAFRFVVALGTAGRVDTGVVRGLEAGGLSLEQSLALWERGEKLADRCEQLLNDAQQRLDAAQRSQEANDSSSA